MRTARALILALAAALLGTAPASAQVVQPPFDGTYTVHDLGRPAPAEQLPAPFGGLTLKAGTTDRLLIGGGANGDTGALYEVGLVRNAAGHITSFSGPATRFADAAFNDGGVTYGPDGVLFLARWPENQLGQTKPGSTVTDKVIALGQFEVAPSLASLQFVPAGQPGAGSLKMASYPEGQWYDAAVTPDGKGTFDLVQVAPVPGSTLPGGPEGFVYVGAGSPGFEGPSMLVAEYDAGEVAAYEVDENGDPIPATRRPFITGLAGAEGAFIDPLTGDFLFSTFGGNDQVILVRGFAPPVSLAVETLVTSDNGGVSAPGDFTVHVQRDGADVVGSPQPGSPFGAFYAVEPGVRYQVVVDAPPGYAVTIGGDCASDGTVVPQEGVQPVCTVSADDQPTAVLTVVTRVENDDGGKRLPEDFSIAVRRSGVDIGGSPAPGAGARVYPVVPGTYAASAAPALGYVADACEVTLADEELKTCTVTIRDVPLGPGLVVEGYDPARTDGDWGLAESLLQQTRGYLQDAASFGAEGIVGRSVVIGPGIGVANDRTLARVDVFFTGWVGTGSYTGAEREALRAFVLGGGTLIATTDDSGHTIVDLFGLTQGDGSGDPTPNEITDADHPIANGPFGVVTAFNQYLSTGHYPLLPQTAHEVGRNEQGTTLAVIERDALQAGSGAAIFVADVDVFSDFGAAFNATLIKNVFAFAAGEGAQPTMAIHDATAAEGNLGASTLSFAVSLSEASDTPVTVGYATADDSAASPSDYAAAAGQVRFAPGETVAHIPITVNGDTSVEGDERFQVTLSNPAGARRTDSQAFGTILNDDANASPPPPAPQEEEEELPPPEAGEEVNALPKSGTVRVRIAGTNRFVELREGQQIPVGSVVDTTKGRVTIVAAGNQSADFYDGIFRLTQGKGARPLTTLDVDGAAELSEGGQGGGGGHEEAALVG